MSIPQSVSALEFFETQKKLKQWVRSVCDRNIILIKSCCLHDYRALGANYFVHPITMRSLQLLIVTNFCNRYVVLLAIVLRRVSFFATALFVLEKVSFCLCLIHEAD